MERAAGRRILSVGRRGKFLLLPLSGGDELVIHLGMTGVLTPERPERHLRVSLALDAGENPALYFKDPRRFGRLLVVPAGDYASLPTLRAMGPEPLEEVFTDEGFFASLRVSSVAVKPYLLSQRPVSGVGNIYADEALWRSGVHPLTPSNRLSAAKAAALARAIREVLAASLLAQGTTLSDYRRVNGESGAYGSALEVYGREGEPCARCGDALEKVVLAGRGTHYCPRCQPLPPTSPRIEARTRPSRKPRRPARQRAP